MFNKLINEKLITQSVGEILFGNAYNRRIVLMSDMLPKTAHEVCLFYSAIVQAYIIGVAQKKGVDVKDLKEYGAVADAVSKLWTEGKSIGDDERIFSFITLCASIEGEELAKKEVASIIGGMRDAYLKINARTVMKSSPVSFAKFKELLAALPLLNQTEFDVKNGNLIIDNGKHRVECKYAPYFAFYEFNPDLDEDCLARKITENCYVLTTVTKGERDGELHFYYTKINSPDKSGRRSRELGKIYDDENLIMICRSMGIKIEWLEDTYWCDFAFIKKLADITDYSLLKALDLDSPQRATSDASKAIRSMFKGTSLEGIVPKNKSFYPSQVKMLIYELFITQGIFKTVYCLMHAGENSDSAHSSEKMFKVMMQSFVKNGIITEEEQEERLAICNEKINSHILKLKKIVQMNSMAFILRANEIKAEQRTICLLYTAGIRNNKIVADAEEILSIDDFYDMFVNPATSIDEDLSALMSLLCCFYGALLKNSVNFNAEKYYKDVAQLRKEYLPEKGVEYLFNSFVNIAEKSMGSQVIAKLIGRECICDLTKLTGFKKKILELREENQQLFGTSTNPSSIIESGEKPKMFISYCRDDNPENDRKITRFADYYRERGIDVFFDTDSIDTSQGWMVRVNSSITDKSTAMVVMFVSKASILRESVEYELLTAHKEALNRFPGDSEADKDRRDRFIVAIDLEEENIADFVDEMWTDSCYDETQKLRITKFHNIIAPKTFRRIHEKEKIMENLLNNVKDYKEAMGEGVVRTDVYENEPIRLQIKNFFCFLKYGKNYEWQENDSVDEYFNSENADTSYCIFPMLASVRETRIKRDNITVIGYEIIRGKGRANKSSNYILSSKKLAVEEYYCLPNYKTVGENCSWMVEPLLISYDGFMGKKEE